MGKDRLLVLKIAVTNQITRNFGRFVNQIGDSLSDKRRDLYEHLIDDSPRLTERHHTHRNVTIAHGDAKISATNCSIESYILSQR
jgi:hypothetical protein